MDNRGKRAEEMLASIVSDPMFIDFVHVRPHYRRSLRNIELADLLIEDQPKALLVQLKVQDARQSRTRTRAQRWAQKRVVKASAQIRGSLRWLPSSDILSNHPVRGSLTFAKGSLEGCHGLVIVEYSSSPFAIDQKLPRRTRELVPIHYLSYDDFVTLCQHLMTLPDLVEYLDQRAKIPAWATPMLGDERNAYAYYLMHQGTFDSTVRAGDFDGEWQRLTVEHVAKYEEKIREDREAEIFAKMLKCIHDRDPHSSDYTPRFLRAMEPLDNGKVVEVARELNRIRRLHRREISKKLLEKIELADRSPFGFNYFCHRGEGEELMTMYVFLASRHARKKRLEQLVMVCMCVNSITEAHLVVGVSTESLQSAREGRSFDFIMVDGSVKDKDLETVERCKKLFGPMTWERIYDFPGDKPSGIIIP